MLNKLSLDTINNHPIVTTIKTNVSPILNTLQTSVHNIALSTLLTNSFLYIGCFILNTNLFILGGAIGFVFYKQMDHVANRINNIFAVEKSNLEKIALLGCGFAAFLALPTTLVIVTLYNSAYLACKVTKEVERRVKETTP